MWLDRPAPQDNDRMFPLPLRVIPVPAFDYVVFGGTGDLSRRKLLPALYHRFRDGQIVEGSRIVAVSRRALSDDEYRALTRAALQDFLPEEERDPETIDRFLGLLSHDWQQRRECDYDDQ